MAAIHIWILWYFALSAYHHQYNVCKIGEALAEGDYVETLLYIHDIYVLTISPRRRQELCFSWDCEYSCHVILTDSSSAVCSACHVVLSNLLLDWFAIESRNRKAGAEKKLRSYINIICFGGPSIYYHNQRSNFRFKLKSFACPLYPCVKPCKIVSQKWILII